MKKLILLILLYSNISANVDLLYKPTLYKKNFTSPKEAFITYIKILKKYYNIPEIKPEYFLNGGLIPKFAAEKLAKEHNQKFGQKIDRYKITSFIYLNSNSKAVNSKKRKKYLKYKNGDIRIEFYILISNLGCRYEYIDFRKLQDRYIVIDHYIYGEPSFVGRDALIPTKLYINPFRKV
jgi:hypothetical protein